MTTLKELGIQYTLCIALKSSQTLVFYFQSHEKTIDTFNKIRRQIDQGSGWILAEDGVEGLPSTPALILTQEIAAFNLTTIVDPC